jgi:ABC-type transport system involved in multi-copper enzyme maturation permease subunit
MIPEVTSMIAILRKDAPANLFGLAVLWPLIAGAEILMAGRLDPGLVLINSCLIVALIVGSILVNEIEEEANGGYRIFEGLPMKRSDIVNAKFLGALLLILGFTSSHYLLATVWSADREMPPQILTMIVVCGVIALSAAGLLYIGVFLFGLSRAVTFLGISFWFVSAVVIILAIVFGLNTSSVTGGIIQTLGRTNRMITASIGLIVFATAWFISARFAWFEFNRLTLLLPQRYQRINQGSAACRNNAGQQGTDG